MNAKSQTAAATPKQGDHVFNAVETAIIRPFETIRSLRSTLVDGEHFIHDYLLHGYSMAKQLAETPALIAARKYVASAGAEDDALRELTRLSSRYPGLVRIASPLLRDIHLGNSEKFGDAARRFDFEFLSALQRSLETAVSPQGTTSARIGRTPSPGIAYQQMLDAAYDPAAALVVIINSISRENASLQGAFHPVIIRIAETLDRPAMWKDPYATFREDRPSTRGPSTTGAMITEIRDALTRMDFIKAPGVTFTQWMRDEIAQKARLPDADSDYGAMLHLIHGRLQHAHP